MFQLFFEPEDNEKEEEAPREKSWNPINEEKPGEISFPVQDFNQVRRPFNICTDVII